MEGMPHAATIVQLRIGGPVDGGGGAARPRPIATVSPAGTALCPICCATIAESSVRAGRIERLATAKGQALLASSSLCCFFDGSLLWIVPSLVIQTFCVSTPVQTLIANAFSPEGIQPAGTNPLTASASRASSSMNAWERGCFTAMRAAITPGNARSSDNVGKGAGQLLSYRRTRLHPSF